MKDILKNFKKQIKRLYITQNKASEKSGAFFVYNFFRHPEGFQKLKQICTAFFFFFSHRSSKRSKKKNNIKHLYLIFFIQF